MTQTNRPSVPTPQQQQQQEPRFGFYTSLRELRSYVQVRLAAFERDFHLVTIFRRDKITEVEEKQLRIERRQDARVNKLEQELKMVRKQLDQQRQELADLTAKINALHVNKN